MGVIRADSVRVTDWAGRSAGSVWRAFDLQLVTYAGLLVAIGLVMAYTNSLENGRLSLQAGTTFSRGLMWAGIAIVMFLIATAFDYKWLKTFAWPLYGFQIGLLLLTLAIGDGVSGAARWVRIGDITFQFSELAKVLMIIVLANYLGSRQGKLNSLPAVLGACLLVGPPLALVMMQPDLGTSLVFAAILAGMLWMSGASLKWLLTLGAIGIALIPFAWNNLLRDYQKARLESFLNPQVDVQGSGYQLYQAQIAVGSGGWIGKGLTNGTQGQGDYLPVQTTDFVFARVGEELGLLGGALVLVLFSLLLWRVLVIGWRSRDPFGLAFAGGVAGMLLFQLMVNAGMVLGVMPITGIPLPFITHGGASLISTALALGLLESIAMRQGRAGG